MTLQAPFPWFGGKRTVAAEIWRRFGDIRNYVEPFAGSAAVLLARPQPFKGSETINDADGFVSNFWRAVAFAPDEVAHWCDWPVNERDLHARHYWLVTEGRDRLTALAGDPAAYDAQVAGWWCWGICSWIGSGWCSGDGPWHWDGAEWADKAGGIRKKLPHLGDAGRGINRQLPHLGNAGQGINRQLPHLGDAGQGINRKLPHLGNAGQGINRKLPHLGDAGRGIHDWLSRLAQRLRGVRVACGDWSRVVGDSVTWRHGRTAVFLDPPYSMDMRASVYAVETDVSAATREWAITAGQRDDMLICLAGYDGEHALPDDWTAFRWKAKGGFGSQGDGRGRANAARETLWFSPACQHAEQGALNV